MIITEALLNQLGLIIGLIGSIMLAFSGITGVISKNGSIIFTGLDPMESSDTNERKVRKTHRRNKIYTPIGWFMIAISFLLQFIATLYG
ncbi:MAG: hypothetical protein HOP30_19045 [Cyclobacteriaceae bacterium]|nr:hypothetical protein [Cyclobacteriaceae bacterium]